VDPSSRPSCLGNDLLCVFFMQCKNHLHEDEITKSSSTTLLRYSSASSTSVGLTSRLALGRVSKDTKYSNKFTLTSNSLKQVCGAFCSAFAEYKSISMLVRFARGPLGLVPESGVEYCSQLHLPHLATLHAPLHTVLDSKTIVDARSCQVGLSKL
jgi:hypothetical protein